MNAINEKDPISRLLFTLANSRHYTPAQLGEVIFKYVKPVEAHSEIKQLNQCQSIIATVNGEPVRCEHPATRESITGRSFVRVCDRCFECFYCTEKSLEK